VSPWTLSGVVHDDAKRDLRRFMRDFYGRD
jgi:hypothetical protein